MDGVMRMDAGFEALVCDLNRSGLKLLIIGHQRDSSWSGASRDGDKSLPKDPNLLPPHGYASIFAA